MTKIDDGGPAFGGTIEIRTVNQQGDFLHIEKVQVPGLSRRDYFAAKAMQALIPIAVHDAVTCGEVASDAYMYADAMIAASKEGT